MTEMLCTSLRGGASRGNWAISEKSRQGSGLYPRGGTRDSSGTFLASQRQIKLDAQAQDDAYRTALQDASSGYHDLDGRLLID